MSTVSHLATPLSNYDLIIEPYYQGVYNLKAARDGVTTVFIAPGIFEYAPLSLAGRVSKVIVGILLIIPVVNTVVMVILQQVNSDYLSPGVRWQRQQPQWIPLLADVDEPAAPETPPTPEGLAARKTQALSRLTEIENMGARQECRFIPDTDILSFDLDAILERYSTDEQPSQLCDFLDWAEIDPSKRQEFRSAVQRCEFWEDSQNRTVRKLLSKMYAYFAERKNQVGVGTPAANELKEQFQNIVDRLIDANQNCVDQMLSQLQGMMLDIVADGYAASRTGRQLAILKLRAGLALCQYRSNLIKEICARQNPGELHMADLERMVVQRLAPVLGMRGEIFNAGARFGGHISAWHSRNAANAFFQEYKPLHYLANELRTYHGTARKLRNELLMWANGHFKISDEVENPAAEATAPAPIRLNMGRRMSEDFDTLPVHDGGNLTPAATLFLLESAGLIRPRA